MQKIAKTNSEDENFITLKYKGNPYGLEELWIKKNGRWKKYVKTN